MGKTASLSILLVCLTQGGYILRPWAHPFTRTGTGLHGVVSGHLPHMMHSAPTMVAVRFVTQRRVISSRRTEWVGDQWAHERERPSSRLTSRQRHLQKPRDRNERLNGMVYPSLYHVIKALSLYMLSTPLNMAPLNEI